MQKTKTITIGGRTVTVSEISVTRIYRLLQGEVSIVALPLSEALAHVKALLPLALDVPVQELLQLDLYSDDLEQLKEAFAATNPIFFQLARALNLESVLAATITSLLKNFSATFAGLSGPDMVPESGDIATGSSLIA